MAPLAPKIVFGTAAVNSFEPQVLTDMLDTLDKHNVKELDTASVYACTYFNKTFPQLLTIGRFAVKRF